MKKLVFALLILAASPRLSHAQDVPATGAPATPAPAAPSTSTSSSDGTDSGQDVRFGVKVFGGIANLRGRDAEIFPNYIGASRASSSVLSPDVSYTLSAGGGVTFDLKLTDSGFSVKPELLYVAKGSQFQDDLYKTKFQTFYLALPVLARYKANGLFLEAGPQLSYLLRAKIDQTSLTGQPSPEKIDSRARFNEVDWGFAVGVGYELPLGLELTARYNGSFNPLLPTFVRPNNPIKAFNSGLELHLGYYLTKGDN